MSSTAFALPRVVKVVLWLFPLALGGLAWLGGRMEAPKDRLDSLESKVDTLSQRSLNVERYVRAVALARCVDQSLTVREQEFLGLPCDRLRASLELPTIGVTK